MRTLGSIPVMMPTTARESLSLTALSLVLIGPDAPRRREIAKAFAGPQAGIVREFSLYPGIDDLTAVTAGGCDAVIIDLDENPEQALDAVENICASSSAITVMAYSARSDSDLLVRCMRAGAREFLILPVQPSAASEALVRAAARRDELNRQKSATGKLLVFASAKGGSGVTTIATGFAAALAKYVKPALVDLHFTLGDAAVALGLKPSFTVIDALDNPRRLDTDFLKGLLTRHASGLSVLAAPDQIPHEPPATGCLDHLLRVSREEFSHVVVDTGCSSLESNAALFDAATTIYLVTHLSLADLRNANRFVTRFFPGSDRSRLHIVLNRYEPRNLELDETAVGKALLTPVRWKIPNDPAAASRAQNAGVPVIAEKSAMARVITEMAAEACDQTAAPVKKKLGLFGL
jgi:pilus assembly protein CpaE